MGGATATMGGLEATVLRQLVRFSMAQNAMARDTVIVQELTLPMVTVVDVFVLTQNSLDLTAHGDTALAGLLNSLQWIPRSVQWCIPTSMSAMLVQSCSEEHATTTWENATALTSSTESVVSMFDAHSTMGSIAMVKGHVKSTPKLMGKARSLSNGLVLIMGVVVLLKLATRIT